MDSVSTPSPSPALDEWDADGFEIPSLKIKESKLRKEEPLEVSLHKVTRGSEKIYLGPNGAPPSQLKYHEAALPGKKQQGLKQKPAEVGKKGPAIRTNSGKQK